MLDTPSGEGVCGVGGEEESVQGVELRTLLSESKWRSSKLERRVRVKVKWV